MRKALTKTTKKKCWYFVDGKKIDGVPSGLRGDVSGLSGDVSDLRGDVSGLRGDVSGLRGYVSDLSGYVDECEITDEERKAGIDISDLAKFNAKEGE